MGDAKTIHVTKVLSSSMIVELIENNPNLVEITCSPSVYNRTSKKYIKALSQLDIDVNQKYNWGSKSQTNGEEFEVLKLSDDGLKPLEIADKLNISLNRVYYLLKKANAQFDNRIRKHDHVEVKNLSKNGLSAKEISKKLEMPVRSVYYILNKK